jgi:hypothetical protein
MRAREIKVELNKYFNFDNISKEAMKLILPDSEKSEQKEWGCGMPIEYIEKGAEKPSVSAEYPLKVEVKKCYSYKSDWEIIYTKLLTELRYKVMLPCKVDWCPTCNGSGGRSKYDIEGYDIDALLRDEDGMIDEHMHEAYWSGRTDVKCNVCNGTKIQNTIDLESCNELQREIAEENIRIIREIEEERIADEKIRRAENGWAY